MDEFDEVFRRLFPAAARVAFRIVGSREAAEDVAAEACARALARWRDIRDLEHRDAWVLRVATNLAIDAVRRKRPEVTSGSVSGIEESVVDRLTLVDALQAISRRQREVLVLRFMAGLSEREVAAALGIDDDTVRTHAGRGLAALRAKGYRDEEVLA